MLISSAHDCSDGGLAVTVAECCFSSLGRKAVGAKIALNNPDLSPESLLFGETPSRIVISFKPESLDLVKTAVGDCPFELIGKVGTAALEIEVNRRQAVSADIFELESEWKHALEKQLSNLRNS